MTCDHSDERTCVCDNYPTEPGGSAERWQCSLYGCMWWLWAAVDQVSVLAGWQHVMVRRYTPPAPAPEGRLFA